MKKVSFASSLFLSLGLALCARAADAPIPWEVKAQGTNGQINIDPKGVISAPSGVMIAYRGVVLTADRITMLEGTNGPVLAEGHVTINGKIKGRDQLWTGDKITYNLVDQRVETDTFKTAFDPFYLSGHGLASENPTNGAERIYGASDAIVTTDNYAQPAYHVRARTLVIVPGEFFEAHEATFFVGDVPVFYLPYYKRRFGRHPNNFSFAPGYRSLYGPFMLTSFNWYWDERLRGTLHLDYRAKRGAGVGPDFNYDLGKAGKGTLQTYYIQDQDPDVDLANRPIPEDRGRITFNHQVSLRTNLTVKAAIRYQSDAQVIRDFFEGEYRANVQPNSFVEGSQLWDNWTLNALVQPRVNDFYESVERLPDLRLSGLRQQIGVTPLYYESESSAGYYERAFANTSVTNFSATRADTFHQVVLPQNYFGWLNFTPRVGGRLTHYSEADGRAINTEEETRAVFNTGAEVSTKLWRHWNGLENKMLELNGLRHIFEPSVNYVYVPRPNVRPRDLPQFDYEVASLRLLPIEFPEYNAIDAIDSRNVLRFTFLNRLQTKREGLVDEFLYWSLYGDWRLTPDPGQSTFSDYYSDLGFKPRTWLTVNSQLRYNLDESRFREVNHRIVLQPNNWWSYAVGHLYLADAPELGPDGGHNLITSSFYYRMNENWGMRVSHHFEARDGTMEEQYYSLYRDLRSWTAALTLRLREGHFRQREDFTIGVTISLKAFPRYGNGDDSERVPAFFGS